MPELPERLAGQTILITGATDGLGRALAGELAPTGVRLLCHGRDEERLALLRDELGAETFNADLASLAEVRRLAAEVRERTDTLHVLVNNAGIGGTLPGDGERMESTDGIELRFAVNYLAGHVLTRELLPLLQASAPARIVFVASAGQQAIDFEDPMLTRGYDGMRAYCQSKLAQIMDAFDLAEELEGTGVTATALHPATFMPTKMVVHAGVTPINPLEQGAQATLRLIADPALDGVSGVYFNGAEEADPDPQARDAAARARLRDLAAHLSAPG